MALPQLTPEAIAPFATVIRGDRGKVATIPEVMEPGDTPGHHAFAVLSPLPVAVGTVTIAAVERHQHSTQTFVPIKAGRWLVVVMPTLPDGSPDSVNAKAVIATPEDAVCIGRNVWHAGLTVLDRPAEFGMIMWRADNGEDGVLHELKEPIVLSVEPPRFK
jgi:ureidoglycolate lyase